MKTSLQNIIRFAILIVLIHPLSQSFGQVGINNPTPNTSSMLDITSTNKGVLIPRMSSAQRVAIPTPATGLMVYETTTNQFFYFDGTVWRPLAANNSAWNTQGNSGTSAATNFIGTNDPADLLIKTSNSERMRITTAGNVGIGTSLPVQNMEVVGMNVPAANNGLASNGIFRIQPSGTSLLLDMGGSGASPSHAWFQARDKTNYSINYNLALNPNGGNVGIGTIAPAEKLHVEGSILMVDGNQGSGKVMTSDANGKSSWQDARRTKYTSVSGTAIATAPFSSLAPMPQMSISFTARDPLVYVNFNAAGANAGGCGQQALSFRVLLNGAVIQATQTSIEDVNNSTAKIWDINIEIPLNVVVGTANTVSVFWGGLGTGCGTVNNGPGSAVAPHGSYRVLTVVEP